MRKTIILFTIILFMFIGCTHQPEYYDQGPIVVDGTKVVMTQYYSEEMREYIRTLPHVTEYIKFNFIIDEDKTDEVRARFNTFYNNLPLENQLLFNKYPDEIFNGVPIPLNDIRAFIKLTTNDFDYSTPFFIINFEDLSPFELSLDLEKEYHNLIYYYVTDLISIVTIKLE